MPRDGDDQAVSDAKAPRLGWPKTLAFSMLPALLLFAVLETACRVIEIWAPPMQVDYGQGFDADSRLFVPAEQAPGRMVTNPVKDTSFQKQEFLIPKPPRTLRVFALGGSSVNYLDYEFTQLARRLQEALNARYTHVEIVNCGGLSYGSHRLVPIAAEVLAYEPDLLLLYTGHNEFEEVQQLELAELNTLALHRALAKSALWRFLRDRIAGRRIRELEEAHNRRLLAQSAPDAAKDWLHEFSPEEVSQRMDAFRNNLAIIIALCQDNAVPVIVGTVPSNLIRPVFPKDGMARYAEAAALFDRGQYQQGATLGREIIKTSLRHQSSDLENAVIRSVAQECGVPLADVEAAIIAAEPHAVPGETLFNDHCHLNPKGNEILAAQYQQQILNLLR